MNRRYYNEDDRVECKEILDALSYNVIGPDSDCCHRWKHHGRSAIRWNPFKRKYPLRGEPDTLSIWSLAFIQSEGYLEVGCDVKNKNAFLV